MGFFVGSSGNDYVFGFNHWDPQSGGGIGSFVGNDGYDTLDYSAGTTGWIWFQPGPSIVQDPTTPSTYFPEIDAERHLFATVVEFEHIIAGTGNDVMYMTSTPHLPYSGPLSALPLWVHMEAGGGNDTFVFAYGSFDDGDIYDGGAGEDIMDLSTQTSDAFGFEVDLLMGTMTDNSGNEATLLNVEAVLGSAGDDTLRPGWTTTLLNGNGGNDTFDLNGRFLYGNQTYIGGDGIDTLELSEDPSALHVDLSINYIGYENLPQIFAHVFDFEVVRSGDGDDLILGTAGRQNLYGGGGDDRIAGRGGNDVIDGQRGDDELRGNGGHDVLLGRGGEDTLRGQGGDDRLRGGGAADRLLGGNGDDRMLGGGGDDRIIGGGGDDLMAGQRGDDRFIFGANHGHDEIRGFNFASAGEQIDLRRLGTFDDFADVLAAASEDGAGVTIATGTGSSILLRGAVLGDLSEGDFLL